MSAAQSINTFIRQHMPGGVCDDCICRALRLESASQVAGIAIALATTSDFKRFIASCTLCGEECSVTSAR